jgi:hypothetical protein
MKPSDGYGANTGQVKAAIKKGGSMAGGKRKGPKAPGMNRQKMFRGKK